MIEFHHINDVLKEVIAFLLKGIKDSENKIKLFSNIITFFQIIRLFLYYLAIVGMASA